MRQRLVVFAFRWRHRARLIRQVLGVVGDVESREAIGQYLQRREWSRVERARAVVGEGTYFNGGANIVRFEQEPERVTVGSFTSIARNVQFFVGGNHRTDWVAMTPHLGAGVAAPRDHNGPIVVGSDVWIGTEAVILSGVRIGDGAVVAARAVVSKDVEPYSIVGGVPARRIGMRFDDATIERLLAIQWWTWPREELETLSALLHSTDPEPLFRYAERRNAVS